MPTYEYKCNQCGHQFNQFQNMTDKPLDKCPKCSGDVQRLISSGGGILLHGSSHGRVQENQSSCCGESMGCNNPKRCCS